VPSLYNIMEEMKTLFVAEGYTTYDLNSFEEQKITRLPDREYPVVLLSRGLEVQNNDTSPIGFIIQDAEIHIDVILNTGIKTYEKDIDTELRKIKDIIFTNQTNQSWCDWTMVDNFNAQLQSTNTHSKVFGGININTSVNYRENEIQGVL